ncbi:hypothetical protein [Fimbriiglobus ruber]|uniref:hypothetical protein n=1 Tax=Fimbriiglobus ruber TaxID=1908690 RepID=UPI001179C090|nr:hypothetical protein [Fimbriiglobus ruber]
MTEAEWLTEDDPTRMWWFVEMKASERKLRLIACACCRRIWHLLNDERSRQAVEMAEQLADGLITKEQADQYLIRDINDLPPLGIDAYSVARSALISHPAIIRAVPSLAAGCKQSCVESRLDLNQASPLAN